MFRVVVSRQSLVWTLILFATHWSVVEGAQTSPNDEQPLLYRRLLAPIEHFHRWPMEGGKYFPYSRAQFEDWATRLENYSESPDDGTLSRIVLQARLEGRQLVDGQGFFDFRDIPPPVETAVVESEHRRFPLAPLGLWISSPTLDDGTEATLSLTSTGETCLVVPELKFRQAKTKRVRFQWSLRSPADSQGQLLFDFQLPRSVSVEIRLDLPPSMIPSAPTGIIFQEEKASTSEFKRWRILLGGSSPTTVTLSFDERLDASQKTAIRQLVVYNVSAQGMKTTSRIYFDKADPLPNDLMLELEAPLQPTEVSYGDQLVPWTISSPTEDAVRILVNLSNVERNDQRELSVMAQSPYPTDRLWDLPRARILSSNVFWQETRGVVVVQRPLSTNKLLATRAIQVPPIPMAPAPDQPERDVFAFQYFDADSQLAIDLGYFSPELVVDTVTQISWGSNEITGNLTLDASQNEGDRYALEFSLAPRWTIDSVKSPFGDDIRSWDILDDRETEAPVSPATGEVGSATTKNKILTILLRRPLRPKEGIRLQIGGRYYPTSSQRDFSPTELVPLLLERKRGEKHFIALNADSPYHFRFESSHWTPPEIRDIVDPRVRALVAELPLGTVLPLDSQTRELRFRLETLKPNYAVEITETVLLKGNEIRPSFLFRCQPADSSVDRLYIHFSQPMEKPWHWTTEDESANPIQARRLSETEIEELLPTLGSHNLFDDSHGGETWELRLAVPQSQNFEFQASTTIPRGQPLPVPLAYFPLAASQKAEVVVESPREYFYQVLNRRLTSIPITSPDWNQYQIVRAAFRYDPREEILFSSEPPLLIVPQDPEDVPATAWVWSLRLDSQFEAEGFVRNSALLLVENRGKNFLRVTLPDRVRSEDVFAVWVDNVSGGWSTETGKSETLNSLTIPLPEGRRFVSVSLEYSFRDAPLTQQRKLYPHYPKIDVPVLSMSWTSWFPPEYDVSPKKRGEWPESPFVPLTMSNLLGGGRFNPFSQRDWNVLLTKRQRREQAVAAANAFFRWIGRKQIEHEERTNDGGLLSSRTNTAESEFRPRVSSPTGNGTTWEQILGDGHFLAELLIAESESDFRFLRRNGKGPIRATVKIDRQAVAALDVFPSTNVFRSNSPDAVVRGVDAFDHAGLVLLVCPDGDRNGNGEYVFYITSFLSAAIHRNQDVELLGNRVRFLPRPLQESETIAPPFDEPLSPSPQTGPPQWGALDQWVRETASPPSPWSVASQIIRLASVAPDWTAFEMSRGGFLSPLYIVHRKTVAAYHWLAFLAMLTLTWRRPLSSPFLLLVFLFLFEIIARSVAPCYLSVPGGAFFGTLVSLGFTLVRTRSPLTRGQRLRERSAASPSQRGSTVRVPVTFQDDALAFELNPAFVWSNDEEKENLDESTEELEPLSQENEREERRQETPSTASGRRRGAIFDILFFGGLFLFLFFLVKGIVAADGPSGLEQSASDVWEEAVKREHSPFPATKPLEPYWVFLPVDGRGRIVGDCVWFTDEFLRKLYRKSQALKPSIPRHWRIDKAEYHGSLAYDALTQSLGVESLKAIYEISLDTESTTIQLPSLPVPPEGGKWDQTPIQPSWQADNSLVFNVENQEKGKHVLELPLIPSLMRREDSRRVSMDIPKVPNAVFRLNVPPEAPPITVPNCIGTVRPNTATSSVVYAELGPCEKLTFSWLDEPSRTDQVSVEVDQLFKLRARSGPVDAVYLRAVFRYRIDNGKIRQVLLRTDPRWQLSGQFKCSEAAIEQVNPLSQYVSVGPDGLAAPHPEVTRLVFTTPVSGLLTIEADFVLKEFSGVGCVRLPQISALQDRLAKSLLAVFRDSSTRLDCPDGEKAIGFESTWAGIGASSGTTISETKSLNGTPPMEDRPEATYDLLKTDPSSWKLGIHAKKPLPVLRLNRTVCFGYNETILVATAEFSSDGEMFQRPFFVPETFDVESVEVKDANNNPVEARWTEARQFPVFDDERMKECTLFFKRGIVGDFSVVLVGRMPTTVRDNRRNQEARIPPILFEDVRLREQSLNLFRAKTVIVDEQTIPGWLQTDELPEMPINVADAVFLHSWKTTADPMSTEASTPAESIQATRRLPLWTISPNEPVVCGEQITSLARTGDGWELAVDLDWTISEGEMETLRFHWDDLCGGSPVVEGINEWKLEQKKGRSELVLLPKRPLSGRQRFRMKTPFAFTGNVVTLPNISILLEKTDRTEITQYVVLPEMLEQEKIDWDLKMLASVDEETEKNLTEKIDASWEEEKKTDEGKKAESMSSPLGLPRLFYQATGKNAAIAIAAQSNRPLVSLCDVSLFIKNNGILYGTTTIDIQSRAHEGFIMRLPNRFDLIQATCAGVASKGTQLSEGRWKIDLWPSDYPQRVLVIFRGSLPPETTKGNETVFDLLKEKRTELNILMPSLEDVDVRETLWTLSFESIGNQRLPLMEIAAMRESTEDDSHDDFLGTQRPISGIRGTAMQLRLNLARLNNLRSILDSVPTPLPGKGAEIERWFTHWIKEWWSVEKMVEFQLAELADVPEGEESGAVLSVQGDSPRALKTYLESMGVPKTSFRALRVLEEQTLNRLGLTENRTDTDRFFPLPTNSLILWGESLTGRTSHHFGVAEGQLKELRLVSVPDSYRFMEPFRFGLWLWMLPTVLFLIVLSNPRTREILRRFPHFSGLTLGFGLWSLFPTGPLGGVIVLLTLLSLFRPAWKIKNAPSRNDG